MKIIIKKYQAEIVIFITLLLCMASNVALTIPHWNFLTFVIDYNTGFGGRKLIGTLYNFLLGGYVSKKIVLVSMLLMNCILLAGLSILIGRFIKKMKLYGKKEYYFSIYTVALYLFCPASLLFLTNSSNMGRMDGFIIALIFLFVPLYIHGKYRILISLVFSLVSMLIHPIFACTYFSFYLALLIYDAFGKGIERKKVYSSLFISFILFCFFCYIQLTPKTAMDLDVAYDYLQSHTNYPLEKSSLYYEYYAPMSVHLRDWSIPNYPHSLAGLILCIVFFSPIFFYIAMFWTNCIKYSDSVLYKNTVKMMNLAFLLFVPSFIVAVDYARWIAAYIICQFLLIGIMAYKGDVPVLEACQSIYTKLRKYPLIGVLVLIYLSSFPKFTDMVYPGVIEVIINKLGISYVSYF